MTDTKNTLAIGLMSGTSLDGVDACLVEISECCDVKIKETCSLDYPKDIQTKLFEMANNNGDIKDVCLMNFILGEIYAQCTFELLKKACIKPKDIAYIASHGQTIFHHPQKMNNNPQTNSTLQIGDISVISDKTGITTVGDFRTKDMSAGGQGAPLVPFADEIIFKRNKTRAIQNIGGIGNVTILSPDVETFAFDTGAGNMMIDYCMRKLFHKPFDEDGEHAFCGHVDENWLNYLLDEPYYKQPPPKTTGRELFSNKYIEEKLKKAPDNPYDIISTATALTAHSIFEAYKNFVFPKAIPEEIILGGGGAHNKFLITYLQKLFKDIPIKTHEDFGIPNKYKEALAFAILGYFTMKKLPNNIPSCTGAKRPVIMGKVSYQ